MNRYKIKLVLSETQTQSRANIDCGYEFEAPLDANGRLDLAAWKEAPGSFPVRRFWAGEDDLHGRLVNKGDRLWYFHYHVLEDPDEFAHQFDKKSFHAGEFVSMRDHGGDVHLFHIASVTQLEVA